MPLFGEKANHMANDDAAHPKLVNQPMIDWLNRVPPAELAAELMPGFGPNGAEPYLRDSQDFTHRSLEEWLFYRHGYPYQGTPWSRFYPDGRCWPILEALQLLEHAELIYISEIQDSGDRRWRPTRLGLSALAEGKDVVRQRIKDRTGL
jgi:hypothetical protein